MKFTFLKGYWWCKTNDFTESGKLRERVPECRYMQRQEAYKMPDTWRTRSAIEHFVEWDGAELLPEGREVLRYHKEAAKTAPHAPVFKTEPFDYQRDIVIEASALDAYALFCEAGAGKTKMTLDLAATWHTVVNVILPLNSLVSNWKREIETHYAYDFEFFDVNDLKKRKIPKTPETPIFIVVGVESLQNGAAYDELLAYMKSVKGIPALCAVDESSSIKEQKAKRTKRVIDLARYFNRRLILNGTPISQGYQDLYSQLRFLSPDILGFDSFYAFRNRYCVMGGFENKQIIGYNNVEELFQLIAPHCTLVRKEDVIDQLPPKMPAERREVTPSAAQTKLYKATKDREMSFGEKEFDLESVLEVYLRLQQIVGGFLPYDDDGNTKAIDGKNPKIAELQSIIDLHQGEQGVIFCRFIPEARAICESLGEKSALFTGDNDDAEAQMQAFKAGEKQWLVTTYKKGAKGHDFPHVPFMVKFQRDFSYELDSQASDRIHRATTKVSPRYYEIVMKGVDVEANLDAALSRKRNMADHLADQLGSNK